MCIGNRMLNISVSIFCIILLGLTLGNKKCFQMSWTAFHTIMAFSFSFFYYSSNSVVTQWAHVHLYTILTFYANVVYTRGTIHTFFTKKNVKGVFGFVVFLYKNAHESHLQWVDGVHNSHNNFDLDLVPLTYDHHVLNLGPPFLKPGFFFTFWLWWPWPLTYYLDLQPHKRCDGPQYLCTGLGR